MTMKNIAAGDVLAERTTKEIAEAEGTAQMGKGKFIALEGIDGSGKSTQIQYLAERLKEREIRCYTTFEPTYSPIGSVIHQILSGRVKTDNRALAALFVADRMDHLLNEVNGIAPMLEEGITVISDRYYFSSYAYHGVDMPMDWVISANSQCRDIVRPSATVFIDVEPDTALERIAKNRFHKELFEKKSRLIQVREKYLEAFEKQKELESIIIVDGNRPPEAIAEEIWGRLEKYFL